MGDAGKSAATVSAEPHRTGLHHAGREADGARLPVSTQNITSLHSLVRTGLFVAALLLIWITLEPFSDITRIEASDAAVRGDLLNQLAFLTLAGAFTCYISFNDPGQLRAIFTVPLLVLLAWIVITVLFSYHPAISARRFILVLIVMYIAAIMPLLPLSVRHFATMLAACASLVIVLCYLGIVLVPALAVHQSSDPMQSVAGNWRGLFSHKNTAGAMMGLFIIIGAYVARTRHRAWGMAIIITAAIFLYFSQAKTPLMLVPVVLIATLVLSRLPALLQIAGYLALFALFNLMTIGSVYFPAVADFVASVMSDPTFTGRTYIWEFMSPYISANLMTGYGFAAFWSSSEIFNATTEAPAFVPALTSGHNSYFDLVLTIGLPGIMLVMAWIVFTPVFDARRAQAHPEQQALAVLFIRIWLFAMLSSSFESILFQRNDPFWFMLLISVFGLRYLTRQRLVQ